MPEPKPAPNIRLRGVRHNNLKNFDLDLPLHRLIVITGLSGSGKSSLAFDTLYAEGQRRYIETFSPYARQFFDRMDKPQVDSIEAIPPAIAIEQRNTVRTTRSTVGTMTEICDHMKVVWPHIAQLHCRQCAQPVHKDSPQDIWHTLLPSSSSFSSSKEKSGKIEDEDENEGRGRSAEILITFDLSLSEKLSIGDSLALIARQGYQRLLLNNEIIRVEELEARIRHQASRIPSITVVQDRLKLAPTARARFVEACEQAYHFGKGKLAVFPLTQTLAPPLAFDKPQRFSSGLHCARCDLNYREPTPALFSFNHPLGACPECKGFGRVITIDYDLAIPDRSLTLGQGAVRPWRSGVGADSQRDLIKFCKARQIPTNVPFRQLSAEHQRLVIEGEPDYGMDEEHEWPRAWYGVKGYFKWLETKSYKMHVRVLLSRYRAYTKCPHCDGARLNPEAQLYLLTVGDDVRRLKLKAQLSEQNAEKLEAPHVVSCERLTLAHFYALPIRDALALIDALAQSRTAHHVSRQLNDPINLALSEVRSRLAYLNDVGLGYLTLDRATRTLSGGETERVNLTTCLGTRLVNTLFVLDEPSVGLHPRDTHRLVRILQKLRDTGNTVVVVEHEASVMRAADQVVDLGPGHGATGGELVFQGTFAEILRSEQSLTGKFLSGREQIKIPERRAYQGEGVVNGVNPPLTPPRRGIDRGAPLPSWEGLGVGSGAQIASPGSPKSSAAVELHDAPAPLGERQDTCPTLRLTGASKHNLKNLAVEIPLNRFVCITGVSGSGKSTLVRDVLLPALETNLKSEITNFKSAITKASDRIEDENDGGDDQSPLTHHASRITGWQYLGRVVLVDQSLLGKTPRSNPAVYIGAFDDIREVFAQSEPARQRGLNASAFSFNSSQGQCERCRGAGFEKIEMQFLSDVFIRCPDCDGRRYRSHILEVKISPPSTIPSPHSAERAPAITHHASRITVWSIADLLDATVDEAIEFLTSFTESKPAQRAVASLKLLQEVGLGYIRLGQPINTLSGGESQRLKLVRHLTEAATGPVAADVNRRSSPESVMEKVSRWVSEKLSRRNAPSHALAHPFTHSPMREGQSLAPPAATLFLFDEPTTGLHFHDVRVLLKVFQRLVDAGHSVIVIEHNLDVIKCADWVIDLGPDAGDEGGEIVAQGTPEEVAKCEASHTGRFLQDILRPAQAECGKVKRWESGRAVGSSHPPTFPPAHSPSPTTPTPGDSARDAITINGAREHNLKNLSLEIPRDQFVVITGVSGSGKSTLAFDLLFAEGQRRFLDSMNVYARQFVEQLSRPDVDLITGIPPTVSIEQRTTRGGGKSTVATVTEVYHFIRLLFARLGTQFCPDCQVAVEPQTRDELGRRLQTELKQRGDLVLLAPVVKNRKGFHSDIAEWAAKHGYKEIRADGKIFDTSKLFRLDRFREHNVEIVVGVAAARQNAAILLGKSQRRSAESPLRDLVEVALKLGQGTLLALDNYGKLTIHSTERACPACGRSFEPLDPKHFSYNSSQGWCSRCRGFGELFYLPDVERGANADAIEESWWRWSDEREVCPECHGARLNPVARAVRLNVGQVSSLSPSSRKRKISDRLEASPTIDDVSQLSVKAAVEVFRKMKFSGRAGTIARDILPEIRERLTFLLEVGLGYLKLGRGVPTLSGGEGQRIRLAAQLGSNLSGVLYVLDEPTIGLHARDNEQLLAVLQKLKARGNSVIVVEHDEETMRCADHIIDLGPGAGVHGGELVAAGTLKELMRHPKSITGQSLRAHKTFPARGQRRAVKVGPVSSLSPSSRSGVRDRLEACPTLTLHNASANNLKNLTVRFPLGRLVLVTGVSGSGKSTLIRECLLPTVESALKRKPARASSRITHHKSLFEDDDGNEGRRRLSVTGHESLKAVYEVDQSPIGRTPRSVPATYVGFFDDIRQLFAQLPEARLRGYTPSRFSFNSAQGRCPECDGAGQIKLEMNFLPPAFVRCESCGSTRFNRETLDIQYGGKNIAQVLDLSVEEALEFFGSVPRIKRPLQALHDTGLDYLKLGQTSPTLSGGEAQRVKLVTHLLTGLKEAQQIPLHLDIPGDETASRITHHASRFKNLFILEEPTIGLHMADVRRLVNVLQRLVDAGHSVIVIEHNLELIAEADWVIDLGPEGGDAGGRIVAEGTPGQIARSKRSHTGKFLRKLLAAA